MCETGLQVRYICHSRASKYACIENMFPAGRACALQALRQQAKLSHFPCKRRYFQTLPVSYMAPIRLPAEKLLFVGIC